MRRSLIDENIQALDELAREVPEGVAAAIGFVDLDGDLFNSCAIASGGKVLHRYHKHYLPNYGVFDENRYFREGTGAPILRLGGSAESCTDIGPAAPGSLIAIPRRSSRLAAVPPEELGRGDPY